MQLSWQPIATERKPLNDGLGSGNSPPKKCPSKIQDWKLLAPPSNSDEMLVKKNINWALLDGMNSWLVIHTYHTNLSILLIQQDYFHLLSLRLRFVATGLGCLHHQPEAFEGRVNRFFLLSGRDFSSILPVVMSFSRAVSTENEGWKHLRDTPWTTFTSQPCQTKHLGNTKFSHLLTTSENHSPLSHLWNTQITRRLTELSCWSWGLGPAVLFWVYFNKPELLWGRDKGMVLVVRMGGSWGKQTWSCILCLAT